MSDFMRMPPSNQTLGELLSNGVKYKVPTFQRDYAWGLEQWEDLLADIENLKENPFHYMGYIVLQQKSQHEFIIIDGQQRLITLSLIILAIMHKIQCLIEKGVDKEANQQRIAVFIDRFIGVRGSVTLRVENKLSLNRNNRRHFRKISSTLTGLKEMRISKTNRLLNEALDFFIENIRLEEAPKLATFAEKLSDKIVFTKIVTQDTINAYNVFETLNARGVQLSTPDLLKNTIFSTLTANDDVTDNTLDELDEDWAVIINQLGDSNFTDFIACHYSIQHKRVSKNNLFKSIKQGLTTPQKASAYLSSLSDDASLYSALLNPNDEWWWLQGGQYQAAIKILEGLHLFDIKQPFSVLMIALKRFSAKEFIQTLKYIYILSIRYNVICRLSPNEQEKNYNEIALEIFKNTYKRASHIKNSPAFKHLYPNDDRFSHAFEFYQLPSRRFAKKIRYLLASIENNSGREINYLDTVLEHICPYHPEQDWHDHFGQGIHDIPDRLGNMVLLEKDELKRADFLGKKSAYLKTSFRLAKKVAEYNHWNLQNLNRYQQWLANEAVKTWRVDYQ